MRRSWSHPDSQASAGRINHGHKDEVLDTFPQRNPRDSGYEQNYKQESPQTGAEFISEIQGTQDNRRWTRRRKDRVNGFKGCSCRLPSRERVNSSFNGL